MKFSMFSQPPMFTPLRRIASPAPSTMSLPRVCSVMSASHPNDSVASWRLMTGRAPLYVSMSRLRVAPDRVGELVTAFRRRAHLVDEAPGFVDLEVWCSDRVPGEVIMVSRWRDRAAFREYMR